MKRILVLFFMAVLLNVTANAQLEILSGGVVKIGTLPHVPGSDAKLIIHGNEGTTGGKNFSVTYAQNSYNLKNTELAGLASVNGH